MALGTVSWFDPQQQHGVICLETGGEVYVTASALDDISPRFPLQGQRVECTVVVGPAGRSLEHVRVVYGSGVPAEAADEPSSRRAGTRLEPVARSEAQLRQLRDEVLGRFSSDPQCVLLGSLDTLNWVLGERRAAPVSGPCAAAASGADVEHEEERAHEARGHPRLSGVSPEYAAGVEQTLRWLEGKTDDPPLPTTP